MTATDDSGLHDRMRKSQQRFVLPPGAREILLVRHGSAGGLKIPTLELGQVTRADPPLLPNGHIQAKAVGERLRHEPISHIFVTSLRRTHQTAAPLVEFTGITPIVVPELCEVHMGEWEHEFDTRAATGDHLIKRMFAEETWEVIPGAETMAHFSARIRAGIQTITDTLEVGTAAVAFVHGGTIGEACRQATGSRAFAFFSPENTSISRIIIHADGRWALRSYNDVAHLAAGM